MDGKAVLGALALFVPPLFYLFLFTKSHVSWVIYVFFAVYFAGATYWVVRPERTELLVKVIVVILQLFLLYAVAGASLSSCHPCL
jgi:hypothetical protein